MGDTSSACELQGIIDRLREHLKHKRYFIVVDDLWDQSAWNSISCAFPENGDGSRVIVTTRMEDIAIGVCYSNRACIYRMKRLEEQDSRRLLFNKVFGPENVCQPQYKEISTQIIKKCGGLPLAIITIASLLASHEARPLSEWESIKNSLGANSATKPTLEEMRGILNLSYMHLPIYLRPCFLYLGMYPEDREIPRDELVRQWMAEGFVCSSHRADLDDVAKSYFNELLNRSMIQPGRTSYGEVFSCRVHDVMLDLILSKSMEDNFISVAYNYEDMARLHSWKYKVRRLSLQSGVGGPTSETLATSMTQVRSYAWFGESQYTPPLSQFKYLRVLAFEFPLLLETTVDLTAIGHLFLLRYLNVSASSAVIVFPTKIQGLVHLQTLVVYCERTQSFPSDISCLANLFHLMLPRDIALPEGIMKMKSLRTLHCRDMSKSLLEDIKGLGELTNLKELYLDTNKNNCLTLEQEDALVSSIGMLQELKILKLKWVRGWSDTMSQLDSLHDPPHRLEVLYLPHWDFRRVPTWIGELCCLQMLDLNVLHLSSDEVRVLGELPSLVYVRLYVSDVSQDKVVVGMGLFPVLEHFLFQSKEDVNPYLSFEAGAMSKLQKLTLGFRKDWRGLECLPCLQKIEVFTRYPQKPTLISRVPQGVRAEIESAFKAAARLHPRQPSVITFLCL
uniref:Uncharacterized protein n=2 Tax=Aegilops tauschii subsp. strangulata TaxID=200361 RepID=A0A453MTY6_AEGTS